MANMVCFPAGDFLAYFIADIGSYSQLKIHREKFPIESYKIKKLNTNMGYITSTVFKWLNLAILDIDCLCSFNQL